MAAAALAITRRSLAKQSPLTRQLVSLNYLQQQKQHYLRNHHHHQQQQLSTLVLAEHECGSIKPSTLSAVQAATSLGENNSVSLLLAGSGPSLTDAAHHATSCHPSVSQVLVADSDKFSYPLAEPWANLVQLIQKKDNFSHVIATSGTFGKNILPRAAALLDVSPITDVIEISGSHQFVRPIYAGNALCTVRYVGAEPCMLTIRSTSFSVPTDLADKKSSQPSISQVDLSDLAEESIGKSRYLKHTIPDTERPDLGNARIVITGGRGLKSAENFKMIEKLAEKLGGAVGATRAAVDAGFVPNDLQVMSCATKPVIFDLPPDRYNDTKVGKIPYCCRNGTVLPPSLDPSKARAIFQLTVYKTPPDLNRTALTPPTKWNITGNVQPLYKCGPPVRVSPTEFPDSSGLDSITLAVASWQVVCNVTKPKPKQSKCCVSFSSFWNESAIPCNTCACGCGDTGKKCDANARAMLLPPDALLVPFANRTAKALAWAHHLHRKTPKTLPCPDNCGVSINWHVDTEYKNGWTARMTLFNWDENAFEDWFAAVELPKAYPGFENVYSFNGTKVATAKVNNTIIFSGLKGLNYLVPITNGSKPGMPMVPGKQQSVISFKKNRLTHGINVPKGDGFPTKFYFNGEECSLPPYIPTGSAGHHFQSSFLTVFTIVIVTLVLLADH